jgi:hypothetical protein
MTLTRFVESFFDSVVGLMPRTEGVVRPFNGNLT